MKNSVKQILKPSLLGLCISALLALSSANAATLIEHADVYSIARAPEPNTAVLVDGGKIVALGAQALEQAKSISDLERVDGTGLRLYPGLISAHSSLGLLEIEAMRASVDTSEVGPVNANVRAQVGINADSEFIEVARAGGVLSVLSVPSVGQGGLFAGQSALINLRGWNYEEMTVVPTVAMHLYWPSTRLPAWLPPPILAQAKQAAADSLLQLEKTMQEAKSYQAKASNDAADPDLRLRALLPMLSGKQPLFIHADDVEQIRSALDFTAKHGLKWTLVGGFDAWRLAAELKAANVSVILGSPFNTPFRRSEGYDVAYSAASKLERAGLRFAIAADGGGMNAALEKNLSHLAAHSVAYGLSEERALRAITLDAAAILGVSERLGSIEVGKDANLILTRGDVLELATPVVSVFIAGEKQAMGSRHTRLCERYQSRYGTAKGESCATPAAP